MTFCCSQPRIRTISLIPTTHCSQSCKTCAYFVTFQFSALFIFIHATLCVCCDVLFEFGSCLCFLECCRFLQMCRVRLVSFQLFFALTKYHLLVLICSLHHQHGEQDEEA